MKGNTGGNAGLKYSCEIGETYLEVPSSVLGLSHPLGALVTLLSFLQPADVLKLTPNCPEFSTKLISSLAVNFSLTIYPNKSFAVYNA